MTTSPIVSSAVSQDTTDSSSVSSAASQDTAGNQLPDFAGEVRDVVPIDSQQMDRFRKLGKHAKPLWRKATQLLYTVHAAVHRERKSRVVLPDELLRQVIWGGRKRTRNWRQDVLAALRALCKAHDGPALLANVGLHGRQFTIDVAPAFLGLLEECCTATTVDGIRKYDFSDLLKGKAGQKKRGRRLLLASLPAGMFGPAKHSGLGRGELRVLQALMGEITRSKAEKCERPDKALVFAGNSVRDASGKEMCECCHLSATGRWVAFGGNGVRRGLGYTLFGRTGNGWLARCGFPASDDTHERSTHLRQFLSELRNVTKIIGGVAVALDPDTHRWFSLDELDVLAGGPRGAERIERQHLRVYASEDYLDRLRCHFANTGGFAAIPGDEAKTRISFSPGEHDLALRIAKLGLTQTALASRLEISRKHCNRIVNGKTAASQEVRIRMEKLLAEASEVQGA